MSAQVGTRSAAYPALIGSLLVACAGLMWSFSGSFLRLAPSLDTWQYLTYRALGVALAFYVYDRVQKREGLITRFGKLGWPGVVGALLMAASFIFYIFSLQTTSVAFTLFVYSSAPMMAGAMAYFMLGEKMNAGMLVAVIFALIGLAIMVDGQLTGGGLWGFFLAIMPGVFFSYYAVMQRQYPGRDFSPSVSGFALIVMAISITMIFIKREALFPATWEVAVPFCNGFVTMGLGFVMYQTGAARIPAASQVLLAMNSASTA